MADAADLMPMGDYLAAVERVKAAVLPEQYEWLTYEVAGDLDRSVLRAIIEETVLAVNG